MSKEKQIVKNHETIVCGWDENKKLVFMRTFDYVNSLEEQMLAQDAFAWVMENCKGGYLLSDIKHIKIDGGFDDEGNEED